MGLDQLDVAEILTIGQGAQHCRLTVLAEADLVNLAVGNDEHLISRITLAHDDNARPDVAQLEATRQRAEHVGIVEVP